MNQCTKPIQKEVKSENFYYCKIGRAMPLWGQYCLSKYSKNFYN